MPRWSAVRYIGKAQFVKQWWTTLNSTATAGKLTGIIESGMKKMHTHPHAICWSMLGINCIWCVQSDCDCNRDNFSATQKFRQQTQNQQFNQAKVQHIESLTTSQSATDSHLNSGIDNGRDIDYAGTAGTSNSKQFASNIAKQRRQVELFDVAGKVKHHIYGSGHFDVWVFAVATYWKEFQNKRYGKRSSNSYAVN